MWVGGDGGSAQIPRPSPPHPPSPPGADLVSRGTTAPLPPTAAPSPPAAGDTRCKRFPPQSPNQCVPSERPPGVPTGPLWHPREWSPNPLPKGLPASGTCRGVPQSPPPLPPQNTAGVRIHTAGILPKKFYAELMKITNKPQYVQYFYDNRGISLEMFTTTDIPSRDSDPEQQKRAAAAQAELRHLMQRAVKHHHEFGFSVSHPIEKTLRRSLTELSTSVVVTSRGHFFTGYNSQIVEPTARQVPILMISAAGIDFTDDGDEDEGTGINAAGKRRVPPLPLPPPPPGPLPRTMETPGHLPPAPPALGLSAGTHTNANGRRTNPKCRCKRQVR